MKIRLAVLELLHADGWTDTEGEANRHIIAFRCEQ
jgi:hypothetical protein